MDQPVERGAAGPCARRTRPLTHRDRAARRRRCPPPPRRSRRRRRAAAGRCRASAGAVRHDGASPRPAAPRARRDRPVPIGEVPEALLAETTGDGDLAAGEQRLEQLGDVARGPAARAPRHLGGIGHVTRRQRPVGGQLGEHPPAELVVGTDPGVVLGVTRRAGGHLGEVQPEVGRRPQHRQGGLVARVLGAVLEEGAVALERPLQVGRPVLAAESRPGDEVGARCDGRRRVELQEGQAVDHRQQVGGAIGVEQLGAHGDAPRLVSTQPAQPRHVLASLVCVRKCALGGRTR